MNVTLKKFGKCRTQATVVLDDERVKQVEKKVVAALGSSVSLPGFRPGKAPLPRIREHLSGRRIQEETVRSLLPEILDEIRKRGRIEPIIPPRIVLAGERPFTVELTFVEEPETEVQEEVVKEAAKTISAKESQGRERALFDLVADHTKVELPSELVEQEMETMLQQFIRRLAEVGLSLEQWLEQEGKSFGDFVKGMKPGAEKRLKIRFGVRALMKRWNISDEDPAKAVASVIEKLTA